MPESSPVQVLGPLIVDRKGSHEEVFDQLRGQGFVRARIDGRVHELDALPKIDPKKKHTIEVVVDRLRIRPDAQQRLLERARQGSHQELRDFFDMFRTVMPDMRFTSEGIKACDGGVTVEWTVAGTHQ